MNSLFLRPEQLDARRRGLRCDLRRDRPRGPGRPLAAPLSDHLKEPFAVLQGALLGFVGLVLAFGLALAVGRYEASRADVVADANAIESMIDAQEVRISANNNRVAGPVLLLELVGAAVALCLLA